MRVTDRRRSGCWPCPRDVEVTGRPSDRTSGRMSGPADSAHNFQMETSAVRMNRDMFGS